MSSPATSLEEICPGLYLIAAPALPDADTSPLWVYFLVSETSKLLKKPGKKKTAILSQSLNKDAAEITLTGSWSTLSGWYFFTQSEINPQQALQFVIDARQAFPPLPASTSRAHTILWLPDPKILTAVGSISTQQVGRFNTIAAAMTLDWDGLSLSLQSGIRADLTQVNGYPVIQFSTKSADLDLVSLSYYQVQQTLGYRSDGWLINLYLDGPAAGSLSFGVGLDLNLLTASFGCNFSYTVGQSGTDLLQYPLYPAIPFQSGEYCAFAVWLNPLLPLRAGSSRFQFDTTGLIGKISWKNQATSLLTDYFFTNNGAALQLQPVDPMSGISPAPMATGAGFAFSLRPAAASPSGCELYLSPVGDYHLTAASSPEQPALLQVMPGLFTREFFRINSGDTLRFINHQPGRAQAFSLAASPGEPAPDEDQDEILTAACTTSWAQWQELAAPGCYFGQPASASFFGDMPGQPFPIAIDVLLETFTTSALFPWVPYGGSAGNGTLNPAASSADFSRFEASILGAARHSALTINSDGPVFIPQNATLPSASLISVTNPQGVLIDVNSDGRWNSLTLAMEEAHEDASPPEPQSFLQFLSNDSPTGFPRDLALTLTQNQLFYVVTLPGADWLFHSITWVGGFKFDMSLLDGQTIMVFKFNTTATLNELSQRHGLWTAAKRYNRNPAAVSGSLQSAIAFAQAESLAPNDPFENFNRIVNDKEWTGVLFFNARINGNGMPADLQMLLGGINGGLRAHHIGIQGNLFGHSASPEQLRIKKTSLFGVIFYDGASHMASPAVQEQPVDYEVEKLIVVFSNSAIAQFNTTVGLTLNQLFGRAVIKQDGGTASPNINPNTLSIKGKYQANSDGVGQVIFISDSGFTYRIKPATVSATQVIDHIRLDRASLVPVSSTPGSGDNSSIVVAQFILSGQLWFNADPFPNSDGLDLFSYGNDSEGLALSGLAVNIQFTLDETGSSEPGSKTVMLDISKLSAQPKNEAIRPDSLMYSIPLKFSRFLSAEGGSPLNAAKLSATSVNILQLEGHTPPAFSVPTIPSSPDAPVSPKVTPAVPVSYVTSSARYALEFDMLLGSLGALGANARLNAKVILAWGPSATVPDNDAAALFVQLPQLSAGAGGFELEGILKTTFGDANLLKVDLDDGRQTVYAFLFNNIQLSVFGYRFPPGMLIDFMVFAGATTPGKKEATNGNNLAWFLSAQPQNATPQGAR
ncbi:hypothetical protein [Erwinia sorbitola]|uniref:Uncharacterized protein n=1 Tax=Erwinia sorbitola TaxID=2681984 RepID=A0ABW9RBI9_9GAMM|nr:hypothetical protein [Erwinia sorbitola]MTD26925.1 hypothetical protein [Erwinia sorbitola]